MDDLYDDFDDYEFAQDVYSDALLEEDDWYVAEEDEYPVDEYEKW